MLQRRRAGAKHLSIHCSPRHTPFVAPSSPKLPTKIRHSTLAHLPIKYAISQSLKHRINPYGSNKGNGILALGWFKFNAFTNPIKGQEGTRLFSHSSTWNKNSNQNHTIERRVFRDKRSFSRLGANVSQRSITTSSKVSSEKLVVERFEALAGIIENIQDEKRGQAELLSEPTAMQPGATVEQTTTVEAVTETTVSYQTEPGQILLESLEFTPEPEPYDPFMEFQILEEELERKQLLKAGNVNKTWSHLLYQNKEAEPPKVHYCKTVEEANNAAALFLNDKFIGFDLEWDPWAKVTEKSPRSHVSLMQIANQSDIALFHISLFDCKKNGFIPENLHKILVSEDILKVGVNIGGDALRVYKYLNISMQGTFELSDYRNLLNTGKVRFSQWKKPLTNKQIQYAAADAYAGVRIFDVFQTRRSRLKPCPPLPKPRVLNIQGLGVKKTRKISKTSIPTESNGGNENPMDKSILPLTKNLSKIGGGLNGQKRSKEVEEADKWVTKYMAQEGTLVASGPQLRAYAMWHEGGCGVEEISKLWRDPPLKLRTVADYILEAIRLESLPYEKEKVKELITHAGQLLISPGRRKLGLKSGCNQQRTTWSLAYMDDDATL
ncbi:uncharacterized protein LAJ45_08562 [Morchella importuna]|uniref:uncharacterized protein n=1 Tax=Morchella importuna TaxID=1174673 RepID=UPI001E8EC6F5|nr:uncharacterized protein LAJ45_08562 [Morchella importuna]KAH8147406.1 hypothetical protein LAJ45_08562 [Morchella importuna]